ncbi:hypothetical protein [Halobaculum sp. P14]|uniref:hypothetical protein n=1 Tax=Halobaculum sp. P14 TaxID=3421638 RepID=UPI003EB82A34
MALDLVAGLLRPLVELALDKIGVEGVAAGSIIGTAGLAYTGYKLAWIAGFARTVARSAALYGVVAAVAVMVALIGLVKLGVLDVEALLGLLTATAPEVAL